MRGCGIPGSVVHAPGCLERSSMGFTPALCTAMAPSRMQPSERQLVVRDAVDRPHWSETRQKKAAASAEIDAKNPLLCSPPSVVQIL